PPGGPPDGGGRAGLRRGLRPGPVLRGPQGRRDRPGPHPADRVRGGRHRPGRPRIVLTLTGFLNPNDNYAAAPVPVGRGGPEPELLDGELTMTTTTNGQVRKTLASQLDRLDSILDGLSEGLNEAVATAVQGAVELAVRQAVGQAV